MSKDMQEGLYILPTSIAMNTFNPQLYTLLAALISLGWLKIYLN